MILRRQKTAPLTVEELDNNFQEIADAIAAIKAQLAEKPTPPEGIKTIEQAGDVLHFLGTYGSDLGTITLPKTTPQLRGEWKTQEYYLVNDWVVHAHKTYACIKNHVATTFEDDLPTNWRVVLDPVARA